MQTQRILEGKVVAVTGAGGGIGRAIALMSAQHGASVVVNDIGATLKGKGLSDGPATDVVREIEAAGGAAVASTASVADAAGGEAIVRTAMSAFGRLDGIVNNAGILRDVFFHKMEEDEWDAVLRVHLYGSYNVARAAAPVFREQGSGSMLHMTSASGLIGNRAQANYAAAKLGIVALSKSIALDMQRYGVRSNCIAPFAWSRMTSSIKAETPEEQQRVERFRQMTPDKIAPLAVYLLSDAASEVSGQIFVVRNNEIALMSQPRPLRTVHRQDGWTPETIHQTAIPALSKSFYGLDVSADVFSWEPI